MAMATSRGTYKWCFVPLCTSTSKRTPGKIFITVPRRKTTRKLWWRAARREYPVTTGTLYCCQDHFILEEDLQNYRYMMVMGGRARLHQGVLPHIFHCQGRGETPNDNRISSQRKRKIREILDNIENYETGSQSISSARFEDSCFVKKLQVSFGLAKCLQLKDDAVPTINPEGTCRTSSATALSEQRPAARRRGVQQILDAAECSRPVSAPEQYEVPEQKVHPDLEVQEEAEPNTKDAATRWDPSICGMDADTQTVSTTSSAEDVQVEFDGLQSSFQRERAKMRAMKSGSGGDYTPKWKPFESLLLLTDGVTLCEGSSNLDASVVDMPDDPLCIHAQEYGIEGDVIYQASSDDRPTQGLIPRDGDSSTPITSQIFSGVGEDSLTSPVTVHSPMLKRKAIPRSMSKNSKKKKKKKKDSPQDNTKRQHVLSFLQSVADNLEKHNIPYFAGAIVRQLMKNVPANKQLAALYQLVGNLLDYQQSGLLTEEEEQT